MIFKQRPKKDRLINYDDPKQAGIISLVMALISLVVLPIISIFAILYGLGGIYFSIRKKSGWLVLVLNILAVLVGLVSWGLWMIY